MVYLNEHNEKQREEHHQAAKLQELFSEINNHEITNNLDDTENVAPKESNYQDIDILNLPPRSEVHGVKKTKTRWKVRSPFIRFLIVLLLVVFLLVGAYFYLDLNFFFNN